MFILFTIIEYKCILNDAFHHHIESEYNNSFIAEIFLVRNITVVQLLIYTQLKIYLMEYLMDFLHYKMWINRNFKIIWKSCNSNEAVGSIKEVIDIIIVLE